MSARDRIRRRRLSHIAAMILAGLALAGSAAAALRVDAGAYWRRTNESLLRQTYGSDVAGALGFELVTRSGWAFGLRAEAAPGLSGTLGLSASSADFSLWGIEATVGRELRLGPVGFYLRAGAAVYHYKQTVDYVYVQDYKVDRFAAGGVVATGFRIYPWRFLFISGDARYLILRTNPYDRPVDLGGWRLGGGLGFVF